MAGLNYAETQRAPSVDPQDLLVNAYQLYTDAQSKSDDERLEKAFIAAHEAWQENQEYLPGINLLARIELERGRLQEAERWIQKGLLLKADSAGLHYTAGHIALAQDNLSEAEEEFGQASRISRVSTKAPAYLAHIKLLKGEYVDAFQQYRELIKTQSHDEQIKNKLFEATSHIVADFYSPELEADLLRWLDFEDVNPSQLRGLATSLLKHKLHLSKQGCPLEIDDIAKDEFLLTAMQKFYFCDPIMEQLFIALRQSILLSTSQTMSLSQSFLPLTLSLARQASLNESVWVISPQEEQILTQLMTLVDRTLEIEGVQPDDISAALLLILMYYPLGSAENVQKLAQKIDPLNWQWPDPIKPFIEEALNSDKQLTAMRSRIESLANITQSSSKRVQAQYESHPYPRWNSLGYSQTCDYYEKLEALFPNRLKFTPNTEENTQVLVAGCGTGEHALRLARYFKNLDITAIDLSLSSLSYAQIQAQKYHLDVRFIQADILKAEELKQKFDLIECSGVLHHMASPKEGLMALLKQLKPGGLIKIALYSRKARSLVAELREKLSDKLPETDQEIRDVRALLLHQEGETWQPILQSPDFYSLSACRDLLFHQLEHNFDLQEIRHLIEDCHLKWVGIVPPPEARAIANEYLNMEPENMTLNDWHTLEQLKPSLFSGMYQFYAQKPE